jgi:hypothetical protein
MSEPTLPPPPVVGGDKPFLVLLDEAMRWTRRYFGAIFPAVAVPVALISAATVAASAIWLRPDVALAGDPLVYLTRMGSFFLALTPLLLAGWLAQMAMQVGTLDAAGGRAVDMRRAWLFVVRPRVLATELLHGAALVASLICCGLPALYVFPLLSFTMAAIVAEGLYFGAALNRSAQLAHYNPRKRFLSSPLAQVLAVMLVGALLNYLVSLILALPLGATQMISTFRRAAAGEPIRNPGMGMMWAQVAIQVLISLLNTAVSLYVQFVISLLFFDLRRRREGADLRQAIDAMAPVPIPSPPRTPLQS